ncbi:hypothetical protein PVA45_00145 [Entomospira entomophila]|uniref:Band 7 domain-containing protein n=1 Tax=Entomospira entomophila TaxID=2719988 RepID=A0A968G7C3_9SPIO|nr:hypothetical protein [Entomospira entomophilus]NIZ39933.1 hypothetical protein [Entomospira entomophilus]WDI35494.1 hypothetical protein PVA45_00145 [Entomospira entomophilus]
MKKILALVLVLFLMAGVLYWIGLPSLTIENNSTGVIYTKTSGYELITEQHRHKWDIRKLLPHNYTVLSISNHYYTAPISVTTELRQSSILLDMLNIEIPSKEFLQFSIQGEVNYRLKQDKIISFLEKDLFHPSQIDDFYAGEGDRINAFLVQNFTSLQIDAVQYLYQHKLLDLLKTEFPHLEFQYVKITSFKLPDIDLYRITQQRIQEQSDYQQKQNYDLTNLQQELFLEQERDNIKFRHALEKLEEIGKVLTKYPILLAYLALEKNHPLDDPFIAPFIDLHTSLEPTDPPEEE